MHDYKHLLMQVMVRIFQHQFHQQLKFIHLIIHPSLHKLITKMLVFHINFF
jgi:hypothetical protein